MDAPFHMPIEIRRSPGDTERWFALSATIGPNWITLTHVVPDELDERVWLKFHLPGGDAPIECTGFLLETPPDDDNEGDVERRSLRVQLLPPDEERVLAYIESHNPFR